MSLARWRPLHVARDLSRAQTAGYDLPGEVWSRQSCFKAPRPKPGKELPTTKTPQLNGRERRCPFSVLYFAYTYLMVPFFSSFLKRHRCGISLTACSSQERGRGSSFSGRRGPPYFCLLITGKSLSVPILVPEVPPLLWRTELVRRKKIMRGCRVQWWGECRGSKE